MLADLGSGHKHCGQEDTAARPKPTGYRLAPSTGALVGSTRPGFSHPAAAGTGRLFGNKSIHSLLTSALPPLRRVSKQE
jgi:hypothetical protein